MCRQPVYLTDLTDGRDTGIQGSWHPEEGRKDRYLERFEYIVDGERLDQADRMENNGMCILRSAPPRGESDSKSQRLHLSLKETFEQRERR